MLFSRLRNADPPPAPERRRSVRHATVMQIAKIRLEGGREELCMLRDVSPEGVKAEIYCAAAPGDHVVIELRTGHTIGGTIAWREEAVIGMRFDEPMPMSAMLAHCSFDDRLGRLRPPRLTVALDGILRLLGEDSVVRVANISQAGMQIGAPDQLPVGAPCAITLPGLAARPATIRWAREGAAGLMLAAPFDYAAFAAWRAALA